MGDFFDSRGGEWGMDSIRLGWLSGPMIGRMKERRDEE